LEDVVGDRYKRPWFMRRTGSRIAALASLLATLGTGPVAMGEDPATQVDTARALFDEARQRMAKGDYAGAAADLEESRKFFHGKGILYNLAVCYEHLGRFASAWRLFGEVAEEARGAGEVERERVARERASAVQPRISHVTIEVEAPSPDLTVTRDGSPVDRSAWGVATPADPGITTITASATGYRSWKTTVRLGAGESETVRVPALAPAPAAEPPEPAPPDRSLQALAPIPAEGLGARRVAGLTLGGAGVASLGVGLVYSLESIFQYNDGTNRCPNRQCSDAGGVQLRNEGVRDGSVASITLAVGISAVAGGLVLWLTGPPRAQPPTPGIGNPSSIRVASEW
jgi:hypothetical protein